MAPGNVSVIITVIWWGISNSYMAQGWPAYLWIFRKNCIDNIGFWREAKRDYTHCDADFEEYAQTYNKLLDQTLYKSVGAASQYILQSGSLWHPLRRSTLKNKRHVSLVFLKLVYVCVLSITVQLGVANNDINHCIIKEWSKIWEGTLYRLVY